MLVGANVWAYSDLTELINSSDATLHIYKIKSFHSDTAVKHFWGVNMERVSSVWAVSSASVITSVLDKRQSLKCWKLVPY